MKIKIAIITMCLGILILSCCTRTDQNMTHGGKIDNRHFYEAIYQEDQDWVKRLLDSGANPNYCKGEAGWVDSNPLKVISESFYSTYDYNSLINLPPRVIPKPEPDVAIIRLLVNAGADYNRLPYIWDRVYRYGNKGLERIIADREFNGWPLDPAEIQKQKQIYVDDANRVLRTFLDLGADPDKLGHPFPFSKDRRLIFFSDTKANKYFMKGTRAINEAIEKGIAWESQVDLLLEYTKLDENSLESARRSKDPKMIDKIEGLWKKQQSMSSD